jgi:hypothetical protein
MTQPNDPSAQSNAGPPVPSAAPQGAPAADAIAAALANRETVMRSLEERRAQVFTLLDAQKQEALDALQRARDMLDQARPKNPTATGAAASAPSLADGHLVARKGRNELRRQLGEALAALCPIPATAGESSERDRDQGALRAAAIIVDLVAEEIERSIRGRAG